MRLMHRMRFRQVFVVGALALAQVGHGIEPEAVDAGIEPALHHLQHRARPRADCRSSDPAGARRSGASNRRSASWSQVQFDFSVSVKMMRVPAYFWSLSLQTYQSRALESGGLRLARLNQGCWSEVWLTTSSVITRSSRRLASCMKRRKSRMLPKSRIDVAVVGDVVAVVAAGARIERQQPERGDAEVPQIIEPLGQAGEIADAVVVAVGERLDVQLVDDGVLEPQRIVGGLRFLNAGSGTMFMARYP